jgi:hypothetical protein
MMLNPHRIVEQKENRAIHMKFQEIKSENLTATSVDVVLTSTPVPITVSIFTVPTRHKVYLRNHTNFTR